MKRSSSVSIATTVYATCVIAATVAGFLWGVRAAREDLRIAAPPLTKRFVVEGDSMMPTLAAGRVCRLRFGEPIQRGDVVAVRWQGKRRVKRVAAVGGDEVDVRDGRLLVNGRRLERWLAERNPNSFLPPSPVRVHATRSDWQAVAEVPGWSRYTHHNPHAGGRATPVTDDYPCNTLVRRPLNPVDRLSVAMDLDGTDSSLDGTPVAFFHRDRIDSQSVAVARLQLGRAYQRDASRGEATAALPPAVATGIDAAHPVAIEMDAEVLSRLDPQVYREIEYRDDRPSGRVTYPMTLRRHEVFVVGDNVPVSVDSRHVGPVSRKAVLGVVESIAERDGELGVRPETR